MVEKNSDDGEHLSLPPWLFAVFLTGAVGTGGGLYGVISPALEKEAVKACYDTSSKALDLTVQHGNELQILRNLIYERTSDRYGQSKASGDWGAQHQLDEIQDRRIDRLERD